MANSISHVSVGAALTQAEYESGTGSHVFAIEHHTGNDTLAKEETGSIHTNLGAGAAIALTLPQDATAGCLFWFAIMAAEELRIDPGAAGKILGCGALTPDDDEYVVADAIGESVMLVADGNGDWIALFTTGTWTEQTP